MSPDKPTSADLTQLLSRASAGSAQAARELFPIVYQELRTLAQQQMASERAGHTLQPTALVHEAFIRMVGVSGQTFQNRAHFFGAAATAIRRILIDHARSRLSDKRGGDAVRLDIDGIVIGEPSLPMESLLELDAALERLALLSPERARLVELRFFAGLSVAQAAEMLGVSERTAARDWDFARAWLFRELKMGRDR